MKPKNKYVSFYYETIKDFPEIELNPERTALLIVDMQNEFILRDYGESLIFKENGEWER